MRVEQAWYIIPNWAGMNLEQPWLLTVPEPMDPSRGLILLIDAWLVIIKISALIFKFLMTQVLLY